VNTQLRKRIVAQPQECHLFGYRRIRALLRRKGGESNHKLGLRVYREAVLAALRRTRLHGNGGFTETAVATDIVR